MSGMPTPSGTCQHCGQPAPQGEAFCCNGCDAAYHIIHKLGLQSYYRKRALSQGERPLTPEKAAAIHYGAYIEELSLHEARIHMFVEGLHCAACVWLIENVLSRQEGVIHARINMTTRRLTLRWDPRVTSLEALLDHVLQLGYRLLPYTPSEVEKRERQQERHLLLCLGISGFAAANVMLLSVAQWVGVDMGEATRNLFQWMSSLISLPAFVFASTPFMRSAYQALQRTQLNMDVPIALALLLTMGVSLYQTFLKAEHVYFESAMMLLFFLLIGRYLDARIRSKADTAARQLMRLQATFATRKTSEGDAQSVPIDAVNVGDILIVPRGETFPADGVITHGTTEVDNSLITGESLPVTRAEGSHVVAGSTNVGCSVHMRVEALKNNTVLSQISNMVEEALAQKGKYASLADRIAKLYAPIVHILALGTFTGWYLATQDAYMALITATAVLIITCPCALALAMPAVQVATITNLYRRGVILKNAAALDKLRQLSHVCYDKTGTLTLGRFTLVNDLDEETLGFIGGMAIHSHHPLSRALVAAARGHMLTPIKDVSETVGQGLKAQHEGHELRLGNAKFVGVKSAQKNNSEPMCTTLYFKKGNANAVALHVRDTLTPGAKKAIAQFNKESIPQTTLSGDNEAAVAHVAHAVGLSTWHAEHSPRDKHDYIKNLQEGGATVLMVGDGMNDAPSLAAADISMAFAQGSNIARTSSDIIIQRPHLGLVYGTYKLSQKAHRAMIGNFAFALGYNAVAIPFAVLGYITPLYAALLMSASSITVMLNALRLNRRDTWTH